jgi:hypothetical protein
MSPTAQHNLAQMKEIIEKGKKTIQGERQIQEEVDDKEVLEQDNTSLVLSTILKTITNKFEQQSLEEAVRLRNAHPIWQSIEHCVQGYKYSIPGLPGTKLLAQHVWSI